MKYETEHYSNNICIAYKLEIVKEHLNNHKSFLELKEKYGFICLLDEQYYHQIYQFDVQYQKIKRL